MSRHRNFRSRQYSYDEDDYYDDYYEEEDDDNDEQDNHRYNYQNRQQVVQLDSRSIPTSTSSTTSGGATGSISDGKSSQPTHDATKQQQYKSTASSKTITSTTEKQGGVIAPPQGWGRPNSTSSTGTSSTIRSTAAAVPGKPSTTTQQTQSSNIAPIKVTPNNAKVLTKAKPPTTPSRNKSTMVPISPIATVTTLSNSATPNNTSSAHDSAPRTDAVEQNTSRRLKLSMVVVGHVDHGKSTLMGQLLVQAKKVTQRTYDYYKKRAGDIGKSSFALAWIMDEDDEERQRGVTMDVAQKTISLSSKYDVYILDAPGHLDFIPQMIVGAALADVALLVYDASTTSTLAETILKEIIFVLRGLGVSQLIVVINKMDLIEWNSQQYHTVIRRLQPLILGPPTNTSSSSVVKHHLQFFQKDRVRFVPCSGWTGDNLVVKTTNAPWYDGVSLVEAIETFKPPTQQRHPNKPLRIVIIDVYQEGNRICVRGKVVQGTIQVNDQVMILPLGDVTTVFKIIHGDFDDDKDDNSLRDPTKLHKKASAGDIIDIVLADISDISRIAPGSIIQHTGKGGVVATSHVAIASLVVFDPISAPILRGTQVSFHMHSVDIPATITKLISMTTTTRTDANPRFLGGGSSALVELKLSERVCLEEYKLCRALGRFVLRRNGTTIAFGTVDALSTYKPD
jgi:elongation factor 1 alpha-like protein